MTPFEATHEKTVSVNSVNSLGEEIKKETAKDRIGYLINDNSGWQYSWHWKNENYEWINQAKENLETEKKYAEERLDELKEAERLLSLIYYSKDK